jgi:DNA-binding NarL/FixJ family response regulator
MTLSTIKILLIGDYSIFRNALRMLIETKQKLKVVGETADFEQAKELITKENPNIILVDLPESEKHETFLFVEQAVKRTPVLILAGGNELDIHQKCLCFGVRGLVLKEKSAETLFKAIEKVNEGELWFDRSIMGQTIQQLINEINFPRKNPESDIIETLSNREKQVVELICKGLKNKNIAEKLFITETTVRHHLTSIFNKLGITSRLELVIYAYRNNLVKIQDRDENIAGNGHQSENGNGFKNGHSGSFKFNVES